MGANVFGLWQTWHFSWRIGTTFLVNVTGFVAVCALATATIMTMAMIVKPMDLMELPPEVTV
jgi:hypothetical protein